MCKKRVLVVGEVFVDTHLDIIDDHHTPVTRLGGIFHAARAFSALGTEYALAYYAPDYLEQDICRFAALLNAKGAYKLGSIASAPNVMLIRESGEAGDQGYHNILAEQAVYRSSGAFDEVLKTVQPTDVLLFPGRFDAAELMAALNQSDACLHIDVHYDSAAFLETAKRIIDNLFLSTSSDVFRNGCQSSFEGMKEHLRPYHARCLLLKENRGGAAAWFEEEQMCCEVPAYPVQTLHSVGVGDVFDAVFISGAFGDADGEAMKMASLCAAKYAETMSQRAFEESVHLILEFPEEFGRLEGVRLAWDKRAEASIYIAAPDFPDVDTAPIDDLCKALEYHNFRPRRPIMENGLVSADLSDSEKFEIYQRDLRLLDECAVLIAVLLNHDPGTMVEMGLAKSAGKRTVLYDPGYLCTNNFVHFVPDRICNRLSEVIDAVFMYVGERQ